MYVYVGFACRHACATYAQPGACEGQKRASNLLELEIQIVVSHHVGVGNRTQVIWRSSQYSLSSEPFLQLS